jgi:putative acetyltransferase
VVIRPYRSADAAATLAVFLDAVTRTASADYSAEQVEAWARRDDRDLGAWDRARGSRSTGVAVDGGELVGVSDVDAAGWIDMMFVAPDHGRRGVATALLAHVESLARAQGALELGTDASLTAQPFFERHGFAVVARRNPVRGGVALVNHRMRKVLG